MFPPELPASAHQQPQNTQVSSPLILTLSSALVPSILCVRATSSLGLCPKYWKVTNHWFNRPASSKDRVGSGAGKRGGKMLKVIYDPLGEGFWHLGH